MLNTDAELRDAVATVKIELLERGAFYDGFVGSIESALKDSNADDMHQLAMDIVDRITGES